MVQVNESPRANQTYRSDLDRRAINATGHLLFGVVWLERRVASVSQRVGSLVELAARSERTG